MRVFGTFHLGYYYEIMNWGLNGINRDSRVFECHEQDEEDEETFYPRWVVVTKSAFLILDPQKNVKNMGQMLAWATLQSLDKLRRNLGRPELVTFVWRQIEGKQPWVLNLIISKHEECINFIVANMQNMGVGVEKNTRHQARILESEVTKEAIAQMDIEQILEHIAVYENAIQNDLSISTVQTLTTMYQKAIEYYSAFDDLMFNDYLNRMQSLLQREDIQTVLNSFEKDSSPQQEKQNQKLKQNIDFDVGDEEENKQTTQQTEENQQQQEQSQEQKANIFSIGDEEDDTQNNLKNGQESDEQSDSDNGSAKKPERKSIEKQDKKDDNLNNDNEQLNEKQEVKDEIKNDSQQDNKQE